MNIFDRLVEAGGLLRAAPLLRNGLDPSALPPGIRMSRGWIHLDSIGHDQLLAAVYNARVTCSSAAKYYGLPLLAKDKPQHVHLSVPRNRPVECSRYRPLTDVRIHRELHSASIDPERPWLAGITTVLERACQCVFLESAVAMLDSARFQGLCDISDIRIPERGLSVPHLREAVKKSRSGSRSILETCARLQLEEAGIECRVAVSIPGVGEVDLVVFDRLVIELDGWQFHADRKQRLKDLDRDRRLAMLGYIVVRYDFETVMLSGRFVGEVLAESPWVSFLPASLSSERWLG